MGPGTVGQLAIAVPKAKKRAGSASTLGKLIVNCQDKGASDDELTSAARQGEKAAASHHKTRQSRTHDWAGHTDIHRPGVASCTAEYVGNEDVPKVVALGHGSNRRIIKGEGDVAGDPQSSIPTGGARDPETEIPCAVPVEGPGRARGQ